MFRRLLILNFRLVHAVSHRTRRRFTASGQVALGALVAAGILGIDTRQSLTYQGFALLLGVLLVSLLSGLLFRGHFRARRHLPLRVTVGQPFAYRVTVENRSGRPQKGLWLIDELAAAPPSPEDFEGMRLPGERHQNWFDRIVGYPRWAWLMQRQAGARLPETAIPPLAPSSAVEISVTVKPLRRGHLRFRRLYVARPDPFGLVKAWRRVECRQSLLVLPRRYPVPRIPLPGQRRYQRGGLGAASQVGDSQEVVSVREYRPGDSPHHIHWRTWARTGRPFVKEFQDEFFVRHALVLDTYADRSGAERFEEAVSVAASFLDGMPLRDSLLDLVFVGNRPYRFTAGRGLGSTVGLLEVLACVEPDPSGAVGKLVDTVLGQADTISGCICVLLDWDETRRRMVEGLRARGVTVLALHILERDGPDPDAVGDAGPALRTLRVGEVAEGLARL